jgi:hypothetical protein
VRSPNTGVDRSKGTPRPTVHDRCRYPNPTAAAALGHDPANYLRTDAHLNRGDLRSAADATDVVRTVARRGEAEDAPGTAGNQRRRIAAGPR